MKIVLATHAPRDLSTAVFRHYVDRASWLRSAGHDVELIAAEDIAPRFEGSRWKPFAYPWRLAARIRSMEATPDLVVGHSFSLWPLALRRRTSRNAGATVLVTEFHGLEPLYHRFCQMSAVAAKEVSWRYRAYSELLLPRMLRQTCRASAAVVCTNREEERYLVERGWADPEHVKLFPGVVDDAFFVERTFQTRARRLVFLGQWLPAKGTTELVRAFVTLAEKYEDLTLTCLGARAPKEQVLADFPPDLRSRVRVVPTAGRDEIVSELAGSELFVFPSHYEGFGLALLEAMASALPIVTTAVGIAADALRHERDALVVPRANPGAISDAVDLLLADARLRERLGRAAAEAARTYRVETWRRRFVELIESCGARG